MTTNEQAIEQARIIAADANLAYQHAGTAVDEANALVQSTADAARNARNARDRAEALIEALTSPDVYACLPPVEEPPVEEPAGRTLLSGPTFTPDMIWRPIEPDGERFSRALYKAFGIDELEHGAHGLDHLIPAGVDRYRHQTDGPPSHIVDNRSQFWIDIPEEHNRLDASFTAEFIEPYDFGWQGKFGFGVEAHHSGGQWPGGGNLVFPDWSVRWVTNNYKRLAWNPLRFGIYIYSTRSDTRVLPGQVWATDVEPDGHRRLVLFDEGPRPVAGVARDFSLGFRPGDGTPNQVVLSAMIDSEVVWAEEVILPSPANRLYQVNAYGGTADEEGPAHATSIEYSNVAVTTLGD